MVSPTKDQQTEGSSASDNDLDNDNTAEGTSTSQTSEKEPSTFDVVMNVLKKPEGDEADEDGTEKSDEDASDEGDGDKSKDRKAKSEEGESDEPSADELKAWKPKTRERFEKLQAKYRDEKNRADAAETDAGNYRKFVEYLDTNGIDQEEANKLFHIGALMKNDPFEALRQITPYYHDLLEITGQILPPDLQAQVKQGHMTQAAALELSQRRAHGRIQPTIAQEQTERQKQRDTRQQGNNAAAMQNAIATWENDWAKSDPDYGVKKDRVLDRLELTLARAARSNTLPKTVQEAVTLANKVRKEVETELRKSQPQRKPVNTVDGGNANSSHKPEAKDTRDVIRRTLNQ